MVSPYYDDEFVKQYGDAMNDALDEAKKYCNQLSGDEKKFCKTFYDAFQGYYFSNGNDLDKKLSKIPKKCDFLFYIGVYAGSKAIDFNNLKSQMSVFVLNIGGSIDDYKSPEFIRKSLSKLMKKMNKVSFDGSKTSTIKLAQSFKDKRDKNIKSSYTNIVGSIAKKVSFLTITYQDVNFVDSACNCNSLFLSGAGLASSSKGIESEFLLTDKDTYNDYLKNTDIHVKQFAIVHLYQTVTYRISYTSTGWNAYYVTSNNLDSGYRYNLATVKYSFADGFSLIVSGGRVDVHAEDTTLSSYQLVNVTAGEIEFNLGGMLEKEKFQITSTNWDDTKSKPHLIVTYDKDTMELDKTGCKLDVDEQGLYEYKPKKGGLSAGAIAGIVIACIVVVAAIVGVAVFLVLRKKKQSGEKSSNEGAGAEA